MALSVTGTAEKVMVQEAAVVALRMGRRRIITVEGDSGVSCGPKEQEGNRRKERKK